MSSISGFGSMSQVSQLYQNNAYSRTGSAQKGAEGAGAAQKAGDNSAAMKIRQANRTEQASSIQDGVKLSEGAQKVLDELKEKYGNMDFFVADNVSDDEAKEIMGRGTKEYSVLLDPDTLEAMAGDDDTKAKYMGMIDDATGKLSEISDQLKDSGSEVTSIGVKFDKDGTAKFFADIKKSNDNFQKKTQEAKEAAKKEAEKAEKAQEKKDKETKRTEDDEEEDGLSMIAPGYEKKASIMADTAEDLIDQIKNFDWSQVAATRIPQEGGRFDLSV